MSGTPGNTYHHGDLRQSLILSALRLLRTEGVSGIRLRELARATGVSHTAPYRHFRDKQSVLAALAEVGFEHMRTALEEVVQRYPDDPHQQLLAAGKAYVTLAAGNPQMVHLMFGGTIDPERMREAVGATAARAFSVLVGIIERGQARQVFRSGNSAELALASWSIVHGLALLATTGLSIGVPDPDLSLGELARRLTLFLVEGIEA